MKLSDVDVHLSKVYVTDGKHTRTYNIDTLAYYGECEVTKVHIVSGKVYIEIKGVY